MDLKKIAEEIREIISEKQKEFQLTFEEDTHKYTMLDVTGKLRDDFPSVSKVMKFFYTEFDSEGISYRKANGDPYEQQRLLEEWAAAGTYSTNMGSRVHFILEKHTLEEFGIEKEVRQPIYECDAEQIVKGDTMVVAGKQYIDLLKERNCILLDTEMVLGLVDQHNHNPSSQHRIYHIRVYQYFHQYFVVLDFQSYNPYPS